MELGYLASDGSPVVVDTLGNRVLFSAYNLSETTRTFSFLGKPRPLETLGTARITVRLHRESYGRAGEVVFPPSDMRAYRTRTSHIFVGSTWRALHLLKGGRFATVQRPFGSSLPPITRQAGVTPPADGAPAFVVIEDVSVKACRRTGSTVHLYATEQKEFTDFVLGKLSATIEFPSESAAKAFARDFPQVRDPASVDARVTVDVDRSKKFVWSGKVLTAGAPYLATIAVLEGILLAAAFVARMQIVRFLAPISVGFLIAAVLFQPTYLIQFRREHVDLAAKFPRTYLERWGKDGAARAGAFYRELRELGIPLDPQAGDLSPLDGFLRSLPRGTYFRAFAMEAAAYVGEVTMDRVGRASPHEWRYDADHGDVVLIADAVDYWVAPLVAVAKVWQSKDARTLDAWSQEFADEFRTRLAFRELAGFEALGFLSQGWRGFDEAAKAFRAALDKAPATTHVLGEGLFRVRKARYGPFELRLVDAEAKRPTGVEWQPVIAIPLCPDAARPVRGRLEAPTPRSPAREDVAVVRIERTELEALGVQVANYPEVSASLTAGTSVELQLQAVADEARVVGPRMRDRFPEAKDHLTPMHPDSEGLPQSPYARALGRIVEVSELVNPYANASFWRIGLDVSAFRLDVVARKERCDGVPAVGHHLTATVWLVADFGVTPEAPSPYIR